MIIPFVFHHFFLIISDQGGTMKKKRFQENTTVAFTDDIPFFGLCRNDIAEIIEIQKGDSGSSEMIVKVVNAQGDTIALFPVKDSQIRELRKDEILHVRPYQTAALAEPYRTYRTSTKPPKR